MKLKPQLKTHWLASQNPLLISLGGIKRVVFTPPEMFLDSDFKCDPDQALLLPQATQPKVITPDYEETRDVLSRSHTLSRDLFWTLFSGHDLLPLRVQPAALRKLAQSIELHDESDQAYSLVGFFRRNDIPPFLNPQFYLQDRSCHWERVLGEASDQFMKPLQILGQQKRNEDFKKTWIVVLEILAWSLQRQRQVGDLQVLWSEKPDHLNKRYAYSIQDIEFVKQKPLAATVMSEAKLKNVARITFWQGLEDNFPASILRLNAASAVHEEMNQVEEILAYPDELKIIQEHSGNMTWKPFLQLSEFGSKAVLESIKRLEKKIETDKIFFVDHTKLTGEAFKPYLKLQETEGTLKMAVSFGLKELGLQHLNFPTCVAAVVTPFFGGLESFFNLDRKDYASKQAQFRQNDLLFLRHQGLVLFSLLELINWHLGRNLTSGEKIEFIADKDSPEYDRQFEKLVKYLKSSIPGLLGKSGHTFESLFSSEVREFFLDYLEKTNQNLSEDRSFILQGPRILEIKNVQKQVLILLRFLLLHFIEESGGKVLMRSQSAIGDKFKESLKIWTEPLVVSDEAYNEGIDPLWVDIGVYNKYMINLLFDLVDNQVDVQFNGTPFLSQDNPFEFILTVGAAEQSEDNNWFDLHPQIFFNGTRVAAEEVKLNFTPEQIGFVEYRGQIYRIDKKQIPSLKSLQKFWDRIKGHREGVARNSFGDKVYRLEKSHALELLMLKIQGVHVEAQGEWKKIFDYFESGLGTEKIQLPIEMQKSLLPHQLEGAQWLHDLYELKLGAILADEMGLGKTFQVLAFLESLKIRKQLKQSLIVVPTSLVYNWVEEKKKFAPDLPIQVFQSNDKVKMLEFLQQNETCVLIATYGLVNENIEFFEARNWNIIVFDEAQNLKNITAIRSVSARKLNANFKVCLTGTPMENNYLEFFSLCDLVVPGSLGSVDAFRKKFYNSEVRTESLIELRQITKPLLLRRTKLQVNLSLPVKTVQQVILPFTELQKEIYKKMAMTFSRQVDDLIQTMGEKKAQIAMFAALMRLRQICSDPAAVPGVVFDEKPVKVQHFLSSLQEHLENNESVIVFTQFLSTLSRIERELKKLNVKHFTLQGSVNAKDRIKLISSFQNSPEAGVMLMTLKTGGVGLNLTKASVVYHLEPWWNPAVENQATDRAHRMGQTKDVKVFNLLIEGSLEERIAELKLKKQNSFDRLFSVDEKIDEMVHEAASSLTREDFIYLLKT
jgi:SNF2 family DNA or RNA helicase